MLQPHDNHSGSRYESVTIVLRRKRRPRAMTVPSGKRENRTENDETKMRVGTAGGNDGRKRRAETTSGNDKRKRRAETTSGNDKRKRRAETMGGNDGRKRRAETMGGNDGRKRWAETAGGNDGRKSSVSGSVPCCRLRRNLRPHRPVSAGEPATAARTAVRREPEDPYRPPHEGTAAA